MKPRIVVVGMGEIGQALSAVLKAAHADISAWDICPGKVSGQKSLFEIVPRADYLFFCVPSWCMPAALTSTTPFIHKNTVVITVSKGLQQETGETAYDLLARTLHDRQPIALMSGAMLAEELLGGLPGFGVAASTRAEVRARILDLFKRSHVHLEGSNDVRGVSFAGVLKNVYALGLGIAHGLKWGGNARAKFAISAVHEMERLLPIFGGKRQTTYGNSGAVDLVATGYSPFSKNVEVGAMLIKKRKTPPSEGLVSLTPLMKLLPKREQGQFKLLSAVHRVAIKGESAREVFDSLLKQL